MCVFFQVGRLLRLFEYRQQHEIEFERRLKLAEARNTHEPDFKEEGNSMVLGNESDTRRVATSGSALATVQQQQQQPLSLSCLSSSSRSLRSPCTSPSSSSSR